MEEKTDIDKVVRILRRPPFHEVDKAYRERFWELFTNHRLFKEWLDSIGYTHEEFFAAGKNMKRENELTEDDTFRILARPDIHAMVTLHRQWILAHRKNHRYDQQHNIKFAKHYGWTWIEFIKARKEAGYFA